jgi:MFS family permease
MVPDTLLPNAVSLYSAMVALSRVIGPTVAGTLVVTIGYGWCFTIDGVSYAVVLLALAAMRPGELRLTLAASRAKGQIRSALRYVLSVPELRISFLMLLIVGVASYNFTVLLPLLVERGLHGSDTQYTLIYAAFSVGGVLGTLVVARRTAVSLYATVGAAAALGGALLLLAFSPSVTLAYPCAALAGGSSVAYITATSAIAQLNSERSFIGRVLGLQTVLIMGTTPIGGPLLGWLADEAGGRTPVAIGSVAAFAAALLGLLTSRALRPRATSADR